MQWDSERPYIRISLCSDRLAEHSLEDVVGIAADLGYEGIEIMASAGHMPEDASDESIERIAQQLANYGMECVALWPPAGRFAQKSDADAEADIEHIQRYMQIAERLQCRILGLQIGGPPNPREAREDHWLRAAHYLRECCDLALGKRLDVVVDNSPGLTATIDDTLYLLSLVDRPNLGVNYGPADLLQTDRFYGLQALARFGDLVFNIHLRDGVQGRVDDASAPLLGEGELEYHGIAGWLKESGYVGFVSAACRRTATLEYSSVDIARHEYAAIRQLLEES
jgi:sugar phosphate isomerase/epimerase